MTLSPGTQLGSFEISSLLGMGGMGEVYCATDTKLGREVAIKVLPVQVTEVAVPREFFAQILDKIDRLRLVPDTG